MANEIWKTVNKGDKVKIYSSELSDPMKIDSRVFTVESVVRSIVELIDPNGKKYKVHKNRLSEILRKEDAVNPTPEKKEDPTPVATPTPVQTPVAPTPCQCDPQSPTCTCTPTPVAPLPDGGPKAKVKAPKPSKTPKPAKVAKADKPKVKTATKADLKGMVAAGWEIWSKPVEFKNKAGDDMGIKVESHYMVMPNGKESRVVNTYNGCFPVANPDGVAYKVADLEKKREQLAAKGYKRRK